MAKATRAKRTTSARAKPKVDTDLVLKDADKAAKEQFETLHFYSAGTVCETDTVGFATPRNLSPTELVVDASEGVIPLWHQGTTLRWRFQERSMLNFQDPEAAKRAIRILFGDAVLAWRDAAPIRFSERHDSWDFEVVVRPQDNCNINGCVLASAFFPDPGRHELVIYPKMFGQSRKEQVETLAHEIGHIFGLRHFFAKVSETAWPSEIFGTHSKFSIMNYGANSRLTQTDRSDLKGLYHAAWDGSLTDINGTPIQLMHPFSFISRPWERTNPSFVFV